VTSANPDLAYGEKDRMPVPKFKELDQFLAAVRSTYVEMFAMDPTEEAMDAADDVFHGADLEDYREDLSAGEYDAIDLNLKY